MKRARKLNPVIVLGLLVVVTGASVAHATATVIPTGAYVPPQQTSNNQQVQIQVGGIKIDASNAGANISVQGVGTIQANHNGANINVNANGTNVSVSASSGGAQVQVTGASVHTDADLAAYIGRIQASNALITSVEPSSSDMRVGYTELGKLFGVMPVSMNGTIRVDQQKNVSIELPWYSMFVTSSAGTIKTNLTKALSQGGAGAGGSLDANTQARILSNVNTVLVETH